MAFRADNPCDRLGPVLGPQQVVVQHMPALPHREVGAVIATVRTSSARPVVKLAFEFLVLTAVRSGEMRGARWVEIDLVALVWTIPTTRMKAKREHRVPLCRRAVQLLEAAQALHEGRELVFPSPQARLGLPVKDLCRRHGFSSNEVRSHASLKGHTPSTFVGGHRRPVPN